MVYLRHLFALKLLNVNVPRTTTAVVVCRSIVRFLLPKYSTSRSIVGGMFPLKSKTRRAKQHAARELASRVPRFSDT